MTDDESKITTDHEQILEWVEKRDGRPAMVNGTQKKINQKGLLRINFPGYSEDNLEEISWNKFFKTFDEKDLVFLFQDTKPNGELSYFCKIVSKNEYLNI